MKSMKIQSQRSEVLSSAHICDEHLYESW